MKLVSDWKRVLAYAWNIRLLLIAGILSGVEVVLPLIGDALPIPTGAFAALSLIITAGAFVARIVGRKEFRGGESIEEVNGGIGGGGCLH